jgi:hypothetical protein
MANNLFTATELLLSAYTAILEENKFSKKLKKLLPLLDMDTSDTKFADNRIKLYAEMMGFENPTISEILLSYYKSGDKLFESKQNKKDDERFTEEKDRQAVDYIMKNLAKDYTPTDPRDCELTLEEIEEGYKEIYGDNYKDGKLVIEGKTYDLPDTSHSQNILEPKKDSEK